MATDNDFAGDFLLLNGEYSSHQIATKRSFQDGKPVPGKVPFSVSDVIESRAISFR